MEQPASGGRQPSTGGWLGWALGRKQQGSTAAPGAAATSASSSGTDDPRNRMASGASSPPPRSAAAAASRHLPCHPAGQRKPLPTDRVRSSIPMGDFRPGHQPPAAPSSEGCSSSAAVPSASVAAGSPSAASLSSGSATGGGRQGGAAVPVGSPAGAAAGGALPPTWVYPSPQMFYNAMLRKGWRPDEEDMKCVCFARKCVNGDCG